MGESFLQVIKAQIFKGIGPSKGAPVLKRVVSDKSLGLAGFHIRQKLDKVFDKKQSCTKEFMYRDLNETTDLFASRNPMKGILIGDRHLIVDQNSDCIDIDFTGDAFCHHFCSYHVVNIDSTNLFQFEQLEDASQYSGVQSIMLPLLN